MFPQKKSLNIHCLQFFLDDCLAQEKMKNGSEKVWFSDKNFSLVVKMMNDNDDDGGDSDTTITINRNY